MEWVSIILDKYEGFLDKISLYHRIRNIPNINCNQYNSFPSLEGFLCGKKEPK